MAAIAELLGSPYKPLGVVGSVGVDHHGYGILPNEQYPPESKTPVSVTTISHVQKEYGIRHIGTFAAQTGTNFAAGAERLNKEGHGGRVIFFAPFAPQDKYAPTILDALDNAGVDFRPTEHDGSNPQALLVSNGDKKALVAKPPETPTITDFDPSVNALVLASLGGNWEQTYNNALDFAGDSIPLGLLGSESQIKKLPDNPAQMEAYMKVLRRGRNFSGNEDEIRRLLAMNDLLPDQNPPFLVKQMRKIGAKGLVSASFGSDGSIILDEDDIIHALRVNPIAKKHIKSTVGAGDGLAAGTYQGLRNGRPVEETMVNATIGARGIIVVLDSLSGQMKASDWQEGITAQDAGFRYETYTPHELARNPVTIFPKVA